MTGICIELKTNCKFCGSPISINALVDEILCHSCQKIQQFTYEYWRKSILDSAVTEGFKFNEGEGQPQTVMTGEFTFHITFGKQHPRCSNCKTYLDEKKLEDFSKTGKTVCEKCKNEISVRSTPDYLKEIFPGLSFLVGEDSDMFSGEKSNMQTPQSIKPILFACPSCAGNLEIDGKDRMITCKFCNSEIYLPDDLWFRLHPVKTIERWYMVYDDQYLKDKFLTWYDFSDVTVDEFGNVYLVTQGDDDEDCTIWSFNRNMKTRWSRTGLNLDDDETKITFGGDEALYVWDKSKQLLYKLSSEDGSTIKVVKGQDFTDEEQVVLDIKQCDSLAVDKDGYIIALIKDHILRFDSNGENIPLWTTDSKEDGGLIGTLSRLFKSKGNEGDSPDVIKLKNKPMKINSYDSVVSFDWNSNIYFLDRDSDENASIAKYDKSGNKIFISIVPLYQKNSKPCFDSESNIYILGKDKNELLSLVRYSPSRNEWKIIISDTKHNGFLSKEEKLAVSPDGTIYCFDYNNRMKIFDKNFNMTFRSEQSIKDDEEAKLLK